MPGSAGSGRGGWWRRVGRAPEALALGFRVERDRAAIARLSDSLEQSLQEQVPRPVLRALQVALDELLTNVLMHAEQASGAVEIEILREHDALAAKFSYFADEFDTTTWQAPARAATIDGTRIGGLGIQLVRSLMDEFGYAYDAGLNVVSLRKRC
jgi:anti-sigma regulatory factor (Ser/Thr protein kinase)